MKVTLEQTEQAGRAGTMVVRIAGRATVRCGDELKRALLEAFAASNEVVLDLGDVSEFDAAFLQLLCAAQKSAAAADKVFHPGTGCSGALAKGFAEAGFPIAVAGECAANQAGHGGDA